MRKTLCGCALLTLLEMTAASGQNPVYDLSSKPHKATVSILAMSISVHVDGGSQQIYLADISLKNDAHQLAKLVDNSYGGTPILHSVLADRRLLRMQLIRNPDCDATGQSFFLRRGVSDVFDTATPENLADHAAESIPCYKVVHQATRLAKVK
jgi:hypothetical protein